MTATKAARHRQHFETIHDETPEGEPMQVTVWITTPQEALPGLEGLPCRTSFLTTWQVPGDCTERSIVVRPGCAQALMAMGLPADLATWVDGILWTELDESADYWRRRGWDAGDLFT